MTLAASCKVSIAFVDGPLVASPTWTDVTAYARSVSTSRGRSTELDDYPAGTCTVVLDNRDRRFDPLHATGPHFGNLKIRRQIKIEGVVSGGSTYPIFRGLISVYRQQWPGYGKDATCTVEASDLFTLLATWQIPATAHELVLRSMSPTRWYRLDDSGATAVEALGSGNTASYGAERTRSDALISGAAGASTLNLTPVSLTEVVATGTFPTALTSSSSCSFSAIVQVTDAGTNTILFRGTGSGSTLAMYLVGGVWRTVSTQTAPLVNVQGSASTSGVGFHHVVVTRSGANVKSYIDGVIDATVTTFGTNAIALASFEVLYPQAVGVANNITISDLAIWENVELSAAQALSLSDAAHGFVPGTVSGNIQRVLDLLLVPSGLYTIGASSASTGDFAGGTDALSYIQAAARTDLARLFVSRDGKITFQGRATAKSSVVTFAADSTASAIRYSGYQIALDDRLVFNTVSVTGPTSTFTDTNSTSRTTYGPRSRSIATAAPSNEVCRDIAATYVARYADPVNRGSALTVNPEVVLNGTSTKAWASVLNLELSDYVTVKRTPPVGSAISSTVELIGIQHSITPGQWVVQFTGAPTFTDAVFVWGTSNWGGTDTWS